MNYDLILTLAHKTVLWWQKSRTQGWPPPFVHQWLPNSWVAGDMELIGSGIFFFWFFPFFFPHELTKEINFMVYMLLIHWLIAYLDSQSVVWRTDYWPTILTRCSFVFYDLTLFFFLHDLGYEFTITHFDLLLSVWITFLALPEIVSAHQQVYLFSSNYHPFWLTFACFYQPITF